MSRILQALKPDEARPGEAPAPVAAQPGIPSAGSPSVSSQIPSVPQRQVTERIAPRRAPQLELSVGGAAAPAALSATEEIERLLASIGSGGTEEIVLMPGQTQLVLQNFPAEVTMGQAGTDSEIELEFSAMQPRRAQVVEAPPSASPQQREALEVREQEVRQAVRGPRADSVVRACAWETTIQADLEDASVAAPYVSLVRRWQQDRASGPGAILVASLGQPLAAAEVAMRAATLLTRQNDAAVLVIDGDTEGALSRRLAIIGNPGLAELLNPQDAHGETIHATSTPRLHVLPRGRGVWPALTDATAVERLLSELKHEYAWLIVVAGDASSAPVGAFARPCAATYAVAPLGDTDVAAAQQQLAALQAAGARILGAIATE